MKKRWIALCLTAMLAVGVTGCGGNASSGDGETSAKTKTESATKDEILDISEAVLYDQEGFKVTATGYKSVEGSNFGWLLLEAENSTDETMLMDMSSLSINGLTIEGYRNRMTTDEITMFVNTMESASESKEDVVDYLCDSYNAVPAGETQEIEMSLMMDAVQNECIGTVQQIDISITPMKVTGLGEEEELSTEEMPEGEVVTLQTEAFDGELAVEEPEGTEIYNQDGIRIIALNIGYDEVGEYLDTYLYLVNDSGQAIGFEDVDMSVNDFVASGYVDTPFFDVMESGQKTIGKVRMTDAEVASTDEVESLEFTIRIVCYEEGNWGAEIGTGTYTYTK